MSTTNGTGTDLAHDDGVMEELIEWVSVIATKAGVTQAQHDEIVGSFTDLLVNHYGEE